MWGSLAVIVQFFYKMMFAMEKCFSRIRCFCSIISVATALLIGNFAWAETIAYWRFEDGPAGANVPHPGPDGAFNGMIADSSSNGNTLSVWTQGGYAGFAYRTNTPFTFIPSEGSTNAFSLKNTGAFPAMFTSATHSLPRGINIQTNTPAEFTIEASYKPEANGGYRTVVGRDGRNVSTSNRDLAPLYLQVRPDDSVGITFTDVSGYTHSAYSPPGPIFGFNYGLNPEGTNGLWYNLAAVSDGSKLKVYVNNLLVATTDMIASGSPNRSLAKGSTSGTGYNAGAWSVGRGLYAGEHTDRAYGFIDEVRISNKALLPAEFLAAPRPKLSLSQEGPGLIRLSATRGEPGASLAILQSNDATASLAEWRNIATRTFDSQGGYSTTLGLDLQIPSSFFQMRATPKPPRVGPLTYRLAAGNQNWPANIRAEIIYIMDGAVAQYNRWGNFNKTLTINYNPGVPTAQANYDGWIDFGNQRGFRTALHEIAHTLGVGTAPNWNNFLNNGVWTGANGVQQIRAFDGPGAVVHSDGTHFWPYGLNFDNEGSTENNRRHVLMVAAFRKDMGIQ